MSAAAKDAHRLPGSVCESVDSGPRPVTLVSPSVCVPPPLQPASSSVTRATGAIDLGASERRLRRADAVLQKGTGVDIDVPHDRCTSDAELGVVRGVDSPVAGPS
jgi:hypothetical protein